VIRWNVFFKVEKIEQLTLIDRLPPHHDYPPSLKPSDDGIMIRRYSRGLLQQHRSKPEVSRTIAVGPVMLNERTLKDKTSSASRVRAINRAFRQP
jgi:hypothetical protein